MHWIFQGQLSSPNRSYFPQDLNTHSAPGTVFSSGSVQSTHSFLYIYYYSQLSQNYSLYPSKPHHYFKVQLKDQCFIKPYMPVYKDILYLYASTEFRGSIIWLSTYLPIIVSGNHTKPYTLFCTCQYLIQC